MRILSLDLERYGPFTDRRVTFRQDARLHVVLGANEAGKSSALAAVTDLLFGIEPRTRFAFLHDMPQMRIGAEILGSDGQALRFRRRKGNRNTLVDGTDAALPDDALAPFLGGLSREVFCRAFGLDAPSLRAGGHEMLNSEGEVGASLFAAASGLRGYTTLQANLDAEAADIFMPRAAQHRTFYQALARYDEARKAIRHGELRSGDWRDLNEEIEGAARRLDEIRAERARIAAEQARLQRLKRVTPLIAEIDALTERAEADADLADVPEAWTERLGRCLARAADAEAAEAQARATLAEAARDLAAVPADAGLLARAEEILEAFRGIDRFDKGGIDLPRLQGEADGFAQDLGRLTTRIGLPDAEALRARQPSDAARTRIEGLLRTGRDLAAALGRMRAERAQRRAEHARITRPEGGAAPLIDPGPLRTDLKTLAPVRDEVARRDALDAAIRREAKQIQAQASRLAPPVADLPRFADLRHPSHEAVARFGREMEALERDRNRALDRGESAARALAQTRERLRRREAGRPIPTRAELLALRAERDRRLAPLRAAALGEPGAGGPADVARCEAAILAADRGADDLVADAARAAEQAADLQRLEAEQAEAEAAHAALGEIDARLETGWAAWRRAWEPAGIEPAPPAEMAAWLTEVETLLADHESLEARRAEHDYLVARIEACRAPLTDLGRGAGLPDLAGLDVGLILARVEDRVAALATTWEAAREAQARARATAEQIARIEAELSEATDRHGAWLAAWGEAVQAIGLPPGAEPDEAESALEAWRSVPTVLREHDGHRRRINGIRRDMEAYRAAVSGLAAGLAPDLGALPPSTAMKALHGRLQEASRAETRRQELGRRRTAAAEAQAAALRAVEAARAGLAEHLADRPDGAAAPPGGDASGRDDPAALHARLLARDALRRERAGRRAELARAADGVAEASLRADLASASADAIEASLRQLAMDDEDLDQRGKVAFADRDRGERRRTALEGGIGAELALAQRKAAEAEIQSTARQWAVLKLASLLLGTAIGRHRSGQQDPLLTRAGALFAALTGGAFAGLTQDYDEADTPRLAGLRAAGGLVHVEGLSEGTRDQLYLALRLAYLEDYAARAEPAPFIGDDLFLTFDDARTGHGLEALASFGGRIQPILFTHHRHVADLARDRLGAGVDILEL
ncbi:ATP-binding protein [Methylobacterium planeticum]|uniref:AAA family ATPase n=1 Tax=Methylobacterium planeticum TaxID=2615211 RepID=A0A6N6MP93_9HYPH|nr:YhaN family protein [Methylobacterium planeticum]KAB1072767.1 AAA family ATPase [Methylobacterium planeticum]